MALGLWQRSAPHAGAARAGKTVNATRHGITLSLHVPRLNYPRNAPVQTTVTVANRWLNHPISEIEYSASVSPSMRPSAPSAHASLPAAVHHPVLVIGHPSSVAISYYLATSGVVLKGAAPTGSLVVSDAATVRTLARRANTLNPPPTGPPPACPADSFSRARLVFSYSNGDRWTVFAHLDGCERASAHGVSGWIIGSQKDHPQAFFTLLDKLVGYHRG